MTTPTFSELAASEPALLRFEQEAREALRGEAAREAALDHLRTVHRRAAQCYTEEEIAERVGMPRTTVQALLTTICNYKIPSISGIFAEDQRGRQA